MDDKTKKGPKDASRIDINEDYEVQYWKERFEVSKEELERAVKKAGVLVKDVEKELKK